MSLLDDLLGTWYCQNDDPEKCLTVHSVDPSGRFEGTFKVDGDSSAYPITGFTTVPAGGSIAWLDYIDYGIVSTCAGTYSEGKLTVGGYDFRSDDHASMYSAADECVFARTKLGSYPDLIRSPCGDVSGAWYGLRSGDCLTIQGADGFEMKGTYAQAGANPVSILGRIGAPEFPETAWARKVSDGRYVSYAGRFVEDMLRIGWCEVDVTNKRILGCGHEVYLRAKPG